MATTSIQFKRGGLYAGINTGDPLGTPLVDTGNKIIGIAQGGSTVLFKRGEMVPKGGIFCQRRFWAVVPFTTYDYTIFDVMSSIYATADSKGIPRQCVRVHWEALFTSGDQTANYNESVRNNVLPGVVNTDGYNYLSTLYVNRFGFGNENTELFLSVSGIFAGFENYGHYDSSF